MIIKVNELEKVFDLLVKKLRHQNITEIEIKDEDNYWIIPSLNWTNLDETSDPDVGSLTDDWESLKKIISDENPTTFVDFDRTSSILRIISEKLNPS